MKKQAIRRLVFAAMLASLVFVATWIAIPTGLGGNINLGDSMLLLGSWLLGGAWSIVACALGASLTDLLGGYAMYSPGTFVIKALMGIAAILVYRCTKKLPSLLRCVLSGLAAEAVMVVGYLVYEAAFLGLGVGALIGVPFNLLQAAASILVATLLQILLRKARVDELLG